MSLIRPTKERLAKGDIVFTLGKYISLNGPLHKYFKKLDMPGRYDIAERYSASNELFHLWEKAQIGGHQQWNFDRVMSTAYGRDFDGKTHSQDLLGKVLLRLSPSSRCMVYYVCIEGYSPRHAAAKNAATLMFAHSTRETLALAKLCDSLDDLCDIFRTLKIRF